MMTTLLVVIGTRPEAIKLFPVILSLRKAQFKVFVCLSNQHTESVLNILSLFAIKPDFSLKHKFKNRTLSDLTAGIFQELPKIFEKVKPDCVIVQGDTTTALAASLCAFYAGIQVAHVEAGLRTVNKYEPFPEEVNRRLISEIATYHFAPTRSAQAAVSLKGISWMTGNTITDALRLIQRKILKKHFQEFMRKIKETNYLLRIPWEKKIVLVTAHRRENWGDLKKICTAIATLADAKQEIKYIFILHPNTAVQNKVRKYLKNTQVLLSKPLDYIKFIQLLSRSEYLITDSGGLQEEAAFLGKFVFVLRNYSERMESVDLGLSRLVGTNTQEIVSSVLNTNTNILPSTVYGNGFAADAIADALKGYYEG